MRLTISRLSTAALYGEGFGLPLIKAVQHGLTLLVRDIPVFREVAGERATYFEADSAEAMDDVVKVWEVWLTSQ